MAYLVRHMPASETAVMDHIIDQFWHEMTEAYADEGKQRRPDNHVIANTCTVAAAVTARLCLRGIKYPGDIGIRIAARMPNGLFGSAYQPDPAMADENWKGL